MEAQEIEREALRFIEDLKIKGKCDPHNIKSMKSATDQRLRKMGKERASIENEIKSLEEKQEKLSEECEDIQANLINLQNNIHWVETQSSKEKKNEIELDILLQEELHLFLLAKKYEKIKKHLNWNRVRGQKSTGPSAALVLFFLQNPMKINSDNHIMPYLVMICLS